MAMFSLHRETLGLHGTKFIIVQKSEVQREQHENAEMKNTLYFYMLLQQTNKQINK